MGGGMGLRMGFEGREDYLQGRRRRVHAAQKRRKGDSLGTVEGWVCARYQDVTVCEICLLIICALALGGDGEMGDGVYRSRLARAR